MVADSYKGEAVAGECPDGHVHEVAADRESFEDPSHCPDCNELVEWSAPVVGS